MKFLIPKPNTNPVTYFRRAGYISIFDRRTQQESYARRIAGRDYPRFHLYLSREIGDQLEVNLHLDAKKPSYAGTTAHSGEYDGDLVENEARRIKEILDPGI